MQAAVGVKTPPTESRLRPQVGRDPRGSGLGRDAAAAILSLRYRPLSGSEDPSHKTPIPAAAADRAPPLWERPWPRQGRCGPQASIQAAVGVRRPLPQNPRSGHRSDAIPVGAALAATRPLQSSGFDTGRCRGQKTPPTEPRPRLRPQVGRFPCGSGLGRDMAVERRRPRGRARTHTHRDLTLSPATASAAPSPPHWRVPRGRSSPDRPAARRVARGTSSVRPAGRRGSSPRRQHCAA